MVSVCLIGGVCGSNEIVHKDLNDVDAGRRGCHGVRSWRGVRSCAAAATIVVEVWLASVAGWVHHEMFEGVGREIDIVIKQCLYNVTCCF